MKKVLLPIIAVLTVVILMGCPTIETPQVAPDATINLVDIAGVTVPVLGATPVTTITETAQYTGTVSWSPAVSGTFAASTAYTATIILTPKAGYTLKDVAANSFKVLGATTTNSAGSGVITAVFPATKEIVINITDIPGVTAPVLGATPVTTITETAQYTGTVNWSTIVSGTFAANTVYTATITLTPKAGFTLTGVGANNFTVAGATSTANSANSGVIIAVFPITPTPSYVSATIGNMMLVAGGTFNNGAANMSVSSFRMSQHEVTGEQYATVMGVADPSYFSSVANNPVESVTWYDAVEFCNKLSAKESLTLVYTISGRTPASGYPITAGTVSADWSANGYRLPTEAEWQFAARGGNNSNNYTYAGSNAIDGVAWYTSNSGNTAHTVGTKVANKLGLYDMSGNVYEWCWDWCGTYPTTPRTDYRGATSGTYRVLRGGSWGSSATSCTVASQVQGNDLNGQYNTIGFRVVRP